MNVVNKVTWKNMKLNKRRTLVTIIGVIVSTAMMMAVATITTSMQDLMQRQTMAHTGNWHVEYKNLNQAQAEAVRKDSESKAIIYRREIGYAQMEEIKNPSRPYLYVSSFDAAGFQNFQVKVKEGRLPQNDRELVLPVSLLKENKLPWKLGDTILLQTGMRYALQADGNIDQHRELDQTVSVIRDNNGALEEAFRPKETREYTIVGLTEDLTYTNSWAPAYTALSYTDDAALKDGERQDVLVLLKHLNKDLYAHATELEKKLGIGKEDVEFNQSLLRYYGVISNDGFRTTLFGIAGIILAIIVIGSVSLIRNAFGISVAERLRQMGMLASVGATRRQKRNSVFFEGALIGLISIPLGILAGIVGIGMTFALVSPLIGNFLGDGVSLRTVVSPMAALGSAALSILTIFISSYAPARRASKVTPIEAIRQTSDVKVTRRAVRVSPLTRRLFGVEGELALKNQRRNKRRYRATLLSLIISVVLFLSVSAFIQDIEKTFAMSMESVNYDIQVNLYNLEKEQTAAAVKAIKKMAHVKQSAEVNYGYPLYFQPASGQLTAEMGQETGKEFQIQMYALPQDQLEEYANAQNISLSSFHDMPHPAAIAVNMVRYREDKKRNAPFVERKMLNPKVKSIQIDKEEQDEKGGTWSGEGKQEIAIAGMADRAPFGVSESEMGNTLALIVSQETLPLFYENAEIQTKLALKSDDPMALEKEIQSYAEDNRIARSFHLYNVYSERVYSEQMSLLVKVFTYGFVILITAICIANIFNTISTSIALRKREFAMLKSMGMTPESFDQMIRFESLFYGLKALAYGLPLSLIAMYAMHRVLQNSFSFGMIIPWGSILAAIVVIFAIVGATMFYSSGKMKKENLIDLLKEENI